MYSRVIQTIRGNAAQSVDRMSDHATTVSITAPAATTDGAALLGSITADHPNGVFDEVATLADVPADLLRALQVADSTPLEPSKSLVIANAQVLTGRQQGSPIEVEALRPEEARLGLGG